MKYTVIVLPEAEQDADDIYRWLAARTATGAGRWYGEFLGAIHSLRFEAANCALALESERVGEEIRQLIFNTRKGLRYRILFAIRETVVYVLHVRGPGQESLSPEDMRRP
jgi:plasmid stabilization system protein ParE